MLPELHCRVGEAACEGWSYKGRMNDVVCCPGLPDQGFIMSPPVCICRQGTAEDYPSGGSSGSASNFRPQALLVLLTAFAGGLVFRSF